MTKRICLIALGAYPILAKHELSTQGGAEVQFAILGKKMSRCGYDVHFVVSDFGQHAFEKIDDLKIHKYSSRYTKGKMLCILSDWINLLKILYRINASYYLIKTPRHLLFPLIFIEFFLKKHVIFVGQIDEDVLKNKLKKKEGYIAYLMYRIGLKATYFTVSQNFFQMKGFLCCFKKRNFLIKNFLSLNIKENNIKEKYILWVGNNHEKKHPEIFIRLAECMPEFQFVMIMSKTAQKPSDDDVVEAVAKINNLDYKGFIPFSSISRYYEEASLFIGTSDMEGFPNTYLQSWQAKTPVVSLFVDPDSVIERFRLGRLSGNFKKLCHDVRSLMEDPQERLTIGDNCKVYIENNHDSIRLTKRYIKFFEYADKYIY
ncbi:glycosyltransferase family 4 protein [Desulfoplanes sp.]